MSQQHLHGTTRHIIWGTSLPFSFSLFPSVLPYFRTEKYAIYTFGWWQFPYSAALWEHRHCTRTACFYTSFPRVQKAQRKATINKTRSMAGTPDFVTSTSHTWYWDCILINGCFRALQTALQVMSCTTPGGAIYMDYTGNGDCAVTLSWKSYDLQSMVLGICWMLMHFVKWDFLYIFPSSMSFYG